ncbi:MAG TPA: acyltransferase [Acidobacteriaceae bacterium]|nr:acyltransferase [Acidobacteriaceae bacterium]
MPDALLTPDAATTAPSIEPRPAAYARKPQLPALTGVRTLLAVNIMFFHFTPPHMGPFYPLINNSYVFVGFFILLSGFILAYNYADRATPLVPREFWRARFARLYPIYLLSLVLFFGMLTAEWHAHSHAEFFAGVILTPLLLQGWSPALATFWNTVAWTLSAEALLYFAFPWLLKLPWPKSPSRLIALLLAIWAIGLIPHTLYLWLNPDHLPGPADRYSSGTWIRTLKYTPMAYVCIFAAGITLGKLQAILKLSPSKRAWIAALSLAAIALFFAKAVTHVPYVLMHGGFLVPLFCALVVGLSGQNIFASIFSWKPIELLGQASYALFLLHFNFINLLRSHHTIERLHLAAYDPWISYAATLVLSIAAMRFIERPARRAILSYGVARKPA